MSKEKPWKKFMNQLYVCDESIKTPVMSDWQCYLFGNKPGSSGGIVLRPTIDNVPNWFVRWMMKVCFDCTWEKLK